MKTLFPFFSAAAITLQIALPLCASAVELGAYHKVHYPPSTTPGELKLGVTHTLWVPLDVKKLQGVIVHQHGCGTGACQGGATAAYDLHWQALAARWDCALLGPSYEQADTDNCRLWSDPSQGSERVFLQALTHLAKESGHPELTEVPWCLWGHSGGGYWAGEMLALHPERIVAAWLRSGAAGLLREKSEETVEPSEPALKVPVMCNPGVKEENDPRFGRIWSGMVDMFKAFRAKGAPISFAPDPRTGHECGDSRYLAIRFFDACLAMRLPTVGDGQGLRPVDMNGAWLAPLLGKQAEPSTSYQGVAADAVWLPNEAFAKAWMEYVHSGAVNDTTTPPAPFTLSVQTTKPNGAVELSWGAEADFESGLAGFVIRRDGTELGRVPDRSKGQSGPSLFQGMSYHDTPEKPLSQMRFVDSTPGRDAKHHYSVSAINSAGLESAPSPADVLIVADEFPAMEVLARRLKAEDDKTTRIVDQAHLPAQLSDYQAVVVYIHLGLSETAERALIDYTEGGGRLVALHHSISSGKRRNPHWFTFLGVELPQGDVNQGGYKWTEDVTVEWVNRAGSHDIMSRRVEYPHVTPYPLSSGESPALPSFTLHETEVYLNHVLKGPRTLLMGLKYKDAAGKTWTQDTAGWHRTAGKGVIIYFMPGHSVLDFENDIYGRIVVNAITAPLSSLQ